GAVPPLLGRRCRRARRTLARPRPPEKRSESRRRARAQLRHAPDADAGAGPHEREGRRPHARTRRPRRERCLTAPRPSLSIVPANEASCDDLQVVFGTRGAAANCQGQRYKLYPREAFSKFPVEERARRLREQTACADPASARTSGPVADPHGEAVGGRAVARWAGRGGGSRWGGARSSLAPHLRDSCATTACRGRAAPRTRPTT